MGTRYRDTTRETPKNLKIKIEIAEMMGKKPNTTQRDKIDYKK